MIVGGLEKVYELSKDFRNESISYKHSPEFAQVEWYEAYADYRDTMERTEALVLAAAKPVGPPSVTFRGHDLDLSPPWQRVRFVDALEAKGVWSRDEVELRAKLEEAGVDTGRDRSWSQLVDHAYSHLVEPELVQPTFVYDWPLELSPFARTTDDDETLVERFEAVVAGMEFANAFSELNDAGEQAERFALQEVEREAGAEESEPGDPDFVEALSYGMPPTGAAGSASTGWRCCSPAATRFATSSCSQPFGSAARRWSPCGAIHLVPAVDLKLSRGRSDLRCGRFLAWNADAVMASARRRILVVSPFPPDSTGDTAEAGLLLS